MQVEGSGFPAVSAPCPRAGSVPALGGLLVLPAGSASHECTRARVKLGREVAGKHPLKSTPQAKKVLNQGFWFSNGKLKAPTGFPFETGESRGHTPGTDEAGKHLLNGPGKQSKMYRLLPGQRHYPLPVCRSGRMDAVLRDCSLGM